MKKSWNMKEKTVEIEKYELIEKKRKYKYKISRYPY